MNTTATNHRTPDIDVYLVQWAHDTINNPQTSDEEKDYARQTLSYLKPVKLLDDFDGSKSDLLMHEVVQAGQSYCYLFPEVRDTRLAHAIRMSDGPHVRIRTANTKITGKKFLIKQDFSFNRSEVAA